MLAGAPFDKLGLPDLPEDSFASNSETLQHTVYKGMIAPIALLGGLMFFARRSTRADSGADDELPHDNQRRDK